MRGNTTCATLTDGGVAGRREMWSRVRSLWDRFFSDLVTPPIGRHGEILVANRPPR